MKFDLTHGAPARYVVNVYSMRYLNSLMNEDHYYFANYAAAKRFFEVVKDQDTAEQVPAYFSANCFDLRRDVRKLFYRRER